MCKISFVFACLAYAGHGRRLQSLIESAHIDEGDPIGNVPSLQTYTKESQSMRQANHQALLNPLRALAKLLLAPDTAAAFNPSQRYGFIGVGTMSSAIVRGLCTLPAPPDVVVLSPRGAEKAAALSSEFPSICSIAASNQEVVDHSDVIFIGVLPEQAEEVLGALKFEERHTVVSLISTAPLSLLQEICAPVPPTQVVRAIPLPPVAKHRGATVLMPSHPAIVALFDALGTVVSVETEEQMKRLMSISALMGQFYAQQRAAQYWLEDNGIDPETAAKWTGAIFHCISYDSATPGPYTLEGLIGEQTPGGINEQVLREMTNAGAYDALTDALDDVLARLEGRPPTPRVRMAYTSMTGED